MKHLVLSVFTLCLFSSITQAQDWPKPTEAGNKALDALIARCVDAGGLTLTKDAKTGRDILTVADPAKLSEALANLAITEVGPLRDAMVARTRSTPQAVQSSWTNLLTSLGEVTGDDRTRGYAALLEGIILSQRNPKGAIDRFRRAAESFEKVGDRIWQAACLYRMGTSWFPLGSYNDALNCTEKALAIRLELLGPKHPEVAEAYYLLAGCYKSLGDVKRALELSQSTLAIRLEVLGPKHPDVASSYNGLAICYRILGEPSRALEAHQKALVIRLELLGPRNPEVAASYNGIAGCYITLDEPARAMEYYQKTLSIMLDAFGPKHPLVAGCYYSIAGCHQNLGQPDQALELHKQALAIRLEVLGPKHPDIADSYLSIASCQESLGETRWGLESQQAALAILHEAFGPNHPAVADCYAEMADSYRHLGQPMRALELFEKALPIRLRALGPKHPAIADLYSKIGDCQSSMGFSVKALDLAAKSLEIRLGVFGPNHPKVAQSYNEMAVFFEDMGEIARALELFEKALEVRLETLGPKNLGVSVVFNNIANCYIGLNDSARALENSRKALAIKLEILGPRHPDVAAGYDNLASCLTALGNWNEAIKSYDLALEVLKSRNSEPRAGNSESPSSLTSPLSANIFYRRARTLILSSHEADLMANRKLALADLGQAAQLLDRERDPGSELASTWEADLVKRGEEASELWPATIGLLTDIAEQEQDLTRLETAFVSAERGASRAFLQTFGRAHAELAGRVSAEALAEIAKCESRLFVLEQKIRKADSVSVEKRDPKAVGSLLDELREAETERNRIIARVEKEFPQYAALRYPRPCSLEEARAALGDDEVALHFVAGKGASFLVVLEKTARAYPTGIGVHRLPGDGEIAEQVAGLVNDKVLMDSDSARERALTLYQTLLGPAAKAIEGKNLVIVAGGSVGELPFEVLSEPDGKGGQRWLVQGHRVRYAPSLTALHFVGLWDKARPASDRPLWALGDPIYEEKDPRLTKEKAPSSETSITMTQVSRSTRGEALTRLVASGVEVEKIGGVFGSGVSDRLLGAEATEAAVKRLSKSGELARYRLIHFASHGVLGLADGLPPGLVLAQGGDQDGEDGYLRLDEVANLKLNADLVVLSACQTARGKRGQVEGVNSLGRAFLYAGCRGVVGSLWKVDDEATSDLMASFYTRLKAGQSTGEALRASQLEAIADDQPPYFWAPFILLGR